ncbi:flagellin [Sphingomonas cavernae]|uniref:Flagellin n=1 Tax=Sphingomonas cavernae TaxID=2320861 RepID=A0A418WPV7_9SPHN|nr:flagellin [Sphingomonas cavernae]RJF93244.1 flagellin-like protein [Sphingomonas cavernae]
MIIGGRNRISAEIARHTRLAEAIARSQIEISGGKRILSPSDDPAGYARVGQIQRSQSNEAVWGANADAASALAARADTALDSVVAAATRAVELITLARTGTVNAEDRQAYAIELAGLAADIRAQMAQTDPRGQPVFPVTAPLAIPVGKGLELSGTLQLDRVFGTGATDLATIMEDAAAALAIADDVTRNAATGTALTRLQNASGRAIDARSEQGARMTLIDSARERLANSKLALSEERLGIEATDVSETVARMNAQQLTLEAAQAAFVRINRKTLFDLLG